MRVACRKFSSALIVMELSFGCGSLRCTRSAQVRNGQSVASVAQQRPDAGPIAQPRQRRSEQDPTKIRRHGGRLPLMSCHWASVSGADATTFWSTMVASENQSENWRQFHPNSTNGFPRFHWYPNFVQLPLNQSSTRWAQDLAIDFSVHSAQCRRWSQDWSLDESTRVALLIDVRGQVIDAAVSSAIGTATVQSTRDGGASQGAVWRSLTVGPATYNYERCILAVAHDLWPCPLEAPEPFVIELPF